MTFDVESILAIAFSAVSSLRAVTPGNKHINLDFLKDLPFLQVDDNRRTFIEGMLASIIATIFWSLTYHSQNIDIASPDGFIVLVVSLFSGPVLTLGWGLRELSVRKKNSGAMISLFTRWPPSKKIISGTVKAIIYRWCISIVILVSVAGGVSAYVTGLTRPYENGVAIAAFMGLDEKEQVRLKDKLQINLEHLQKELGSVPKYYGEEVADTDSADEAAFNSNQRFVIWGSIYIEERSDYLTADISIRYRDAFKKTEAYRSKEYSVEGENRGEIINRIANDLTLAAVYTLGRAKSGDNPTYDSAVQTAIILSRLSSEDIHSNIPETKNLGLVMMDMGYRELDSKLREIGTGNRELVKIYKDTITILEEARYAGKDYALARHYYWYGSTLVVGFIDDKNRQTGIESLNMAIEKDPNYPMPNYRLAWFYQLPKGSDDEAEKNGREFLRKFDMFYGELVEDAQLCFNEYSFISNLIKELETKSDGE